MSKIWIKPLRSLFVGDTALQENKAVELPEDEANELLKNGWAELSEKPKNKGKGKLNDDPLSDAEQQNGDGEQLQVLSEQPQQAENQNV